MSGRLCSFSGCGRAHASRGYCSGHLYHLRRGNPLVPLREYVQGGRAGACSFPGCDRPANAKNLCSSHRRHEREGKELRPLRVVAARGSGYTDPKGYKLVNHRRVHRALMAAYIGRELLPTETVHHRNGDRADNRIENLELWSSSHPAGQRVEDKVAWARELLALYEGYASPHAQAVLR